jgi:hypothetical protein
MKRISQEKSTLLLLTTLIAYAILLAGKNVDIFITPRFWAEEAAVYYTDAFNNGIGAIFSTHQGYYSIVPNIATYLATLFPMELAPVVTTYISFFIQIIPAYLILKSDNFSYKCKIALLISLLFAGFTNEIFTNTITSQFHFIVIAYLLLIGNYKTKTSASLLFISALSGPSACFIFPFFLIKAFFEPQKNNIINTSVFLIGTLIQLTFVVFVERLGSIEGTNIFSLIFIEKIVNLSFFNLWYGANAFLLKALTLFIVFYSIQRQGNKKRKEIIFFYLIPLIFVTFLSTATSFHAIGLGRYAYASSFIFCCLILKLIIENADDLLISYALAGILLISILISGKNTYQSPEGHFHSSHWISWESQVSNFKKGKTDNILIYPQWEDAMWRFKP